MVKTWKVKLALGAMLFLAGIFMLVYEGNLLLIFSIPLIVVGLVLLATLAHGKITDLRKTAGVTAVGVFALLSSIGLGLLSWLGAALAGIGSMGTGIPLRESLLLVSLAVFALSGLFLSIIVLRSVSSKYLWYALMAYWISLLAFSFVRDFTNLENIVRHFYLPSFCIWSLPTYVYPASCIAYFLTKKPRQYFNIKQ